MQINIVVPFEVRDIIRTLQERGFLAYIVGGCVRDIILGIEPKDWDITTSATPEQIQEIFPESVYENKFGTVGVKIKTSNEKVKIIEVTTFRTESGYVDSRHPETVTFVTTVGEDLSRRDFTVNAMAIEFITHDEKPEYKIIDLYAGQKDLEKKIVRAVGDAQERFHEDALRMLRAIRFSCQLGTGWVIEKETQEAIQTLAPSLKNISQERIRDEFVKILMTPQGAWGVELLYRYGLLEYIVPELLEGVGVGQNKHHIYTVWEHNLRALAYAIDKNYALEIRLGALLHDVGKPRTKGGDGPNSTFYKHEYVGAHMTRGILNRLRFSKQIVSYVTHLVKNHLFYYNVDEVSEAGVRRFINRVGIENVDDLIKIREADRIGSGVPKAVPYKLRHLLFMIDKVRRDPISPKMLAVDGTQIMEALRLKPSPRLGWILGILLEDILDDPQKNVTELLIARAKELNLLNEDEIKKLYIKSKERAQECEAGIEGEMKKKHKV
ncbi:MAG: HDIG domain-containing metalloprotein [Candidatus Paceibacterota bacterium]